MKFSIDSKDFKTAITKVLQLKDGILSSLQGFQKNTSTPAPQTTYNPFAQQQK